MLTSRSNVVTVRFHSDASYVDQGFHAEFKAFVPSNRKRSRPPSLTVCPLAAALSFSSCLPVWLGSVSRELPVSQRLVHQPNAAVRRLGRLRGRRRRGRVQ